MDPLESKTKQQPQDRSEDRTLPEDLLVGSVLFVTAMLYVATLRFGFVFDDEGQILQNTLVHFWRFVPQYFQGQVWQYQFTNAGGNYYRPLNLLWLRFNDALFGLHPAGWHATAVGLHLLVTFLAYKVARKVTGRPLVATLAALIFAVHPMRHEVVAWVSGTTESLWSVFFFAGFLSYLRSREVHRVRWMAVSSILYAGGLLCKETAIVFPAVVFAHAWIYGDRASDQEQRTTWQRLPGAVALALAYAPVAILYIIVRVHVLHGFSHAPATMSLETYAFTLPSILFFYVKQWLFPLHLSVFYDTPAWSHFSVRHVLLPLMGLVLVTVIVWLFRSRLGTREVAFAAACILIPLGPALYLGALPLGELAHDRYFYVPGFGAALLVALAFEKLARGKLVWRLPQRWVLATLGLLILLCYDTANATRYWASDSVLYTHAYGIAPQNFILRNNYAHELVLQGDYGHALPMFQQLLKERPNSWLVNLNVGRLLYLLGLYPAAEHYLDYARELAPALPESYLDLALVDLRTNRLSEAEAKLRQAVALRPYEPMFHFALGIVLARRGVCSQARPQFAETLAYNAKFPKARELMNNCQSGAASTHGDQVRAANRRQPATLVPHAQGKIGVAGDPPGDKPPTTIKSKK